MTSTTLDVQTQPPFTSAVVPKNGSQSPLKVMRLWGRCGYVFQGPIDCSIALTRRLKPQRLISSAREWRPLSPVHPRSRPYGLKRHNSHLSSFARSDDTIYALSTAPGKAAIAIIRISGSDALSVYRALCPGSPVPKPRYATLRTLYKPLPSRDGNRQEILDSGALVLYFPAPKTITGEDVLELHVHGGPAIVKVVLAAIPECAPVFGSPDLSSSRGEAAASRIRYAEPGEFTRRAFFSARMSLPQIEALSSSLSAETEQQRLLAVQGASSNLISRQYEDWREMLLAARGELEALIDFAEDQDLPDSPFDLCVSVASQVKSLVKLLEQSIANAVRGELLRAGIDVALIGAPNAGKSSLLNLIVGREAAIVSTEAGTTRDVLDVSVDIGGFLVRFGDLAGLRSADNLDGGQEWRVGGVEREGMRRARDRALNADVVIIIAEAKKRTSETRNIGGGRLLDPEVIHLIERLEPEEQKVVVVLNKTDHFDTDEDIQVACKAFLAENVSLRRFSPLVLPISCKNARDTRSGSHTNDPGGLQTFLRALTDVFRSMTSPQIPLSSNELPLVLQDNFWTASLGATQRQQLLLADCLSHLRTFLSLFRNGGVQENDTGSYDPVVIQRDQTADFEGFDVVQAAENLRSAADCLARITGRAGTSGGGGVGDVEEVLGVVFEKWVLRIHPPFGPMTDESCRFCVGK